MPHGFYKTWISLFLIFICVQEILFDSFCILSFSLNIKTTPRNRVLCLLKINKKNLYIKSNQIKLETEKGKIEGTEKVKKQSIAEEKK